MDFSINGAAYPKTKHYLNSLPNGIDSHPECMTTTDFLQLLWPQVGPLMTDANFPQQLRARLDKPLKSGTWIPATSLVVCALLLRDRTFTNAESYGAYMFERGQEVYQNPLYKAMMFVLSPNLVVVGAAKRWASFYKGTQLQTVDMKKNEANVKLTFPAHLFPEDFLMALGNMFCAALACARAKSPHYELLESEPTSATYRLKWS